jgi:hypothetical protein
MHGAMRSQGIGSCELLCKRTRLATRAFLQGVIVKWLVSNGCLVVMGNSYS